VLIKYFLYRKLELALRDKKPIHPVQQLLQKYFPLSQIKVKSSFSALYQHWKNNSSEVNYLLPSPNYNDTLDFIICRLQEYYNESLILGPTLILCGGPLHRW
jgi:hypothetical protein